MFVSWNAKFLPETSSALGSRVKGGVLMLPASVEINAHTCRFSLCFPSDPAPNRSPFLFCRDTQICFLLPLSPKLLFVRTLWPCHIGNIRASQARDLEGSQRTSVHANLTKSRVTMSGVMHTSLIPEIRRQAELYEFKTSRSSQWDFISNQTDRKRNKRY